MGTSMVFFIFIQEYVYWGQLLNILNGLMIVYIVKIRTGQAACWTLFSLIRTRDVRGGGDLKTVLHHRITLVQIGSVNIGSTRGNLKKWPKRGGGDPPLLGYLMFFLYLLYHANTISTWFTVGIIYTFSFNDIFFLFLFS